MDSQHNSSGTSTLHDTKGPVKSGQSAGFYRWLLTRALKSWGNPAIQFILWDGHVIHANNAKPVASIYIYNQSILIKLVMYPDLYFGEGYMTGDIGIEGDFVAALETIYTSRANSTSIIIIEKLAYAFKQLFRNNSLDASHDNIHHHYDIGNDFYKLWLDTAAMQYTCAYFQWPEASLEQAQIAKMDHICRKLQLTPGETVVEAGCGWGGFALHMAKNYGVKVKAYNISHEQIEYARQLAYKENLSDKIEFIEDDFRNIKGKYDVFVSIGMLEHIGNRNYKTLGNIINQCLKESGRGLIHSIGSNYPSPLNAWIEKRIFPNAYTPCISEMMDVFEPNHYSVLDVENLRLHYAKTLQHWLQRFEQHNDDIEKMFGKEFVRAWRLYLCGSIAAFHSGKLQLFQVHFTRERNNNIAWTREHIYQQAPKQIQNNG